MFRINQYNVTIVSQVEANPSWYLSLAQLSPSFLLRLSNVYPSKASYRGPEPRVYNDAIKAVLWVPNIDRTLQYVSKICKENNDGAIVKN